MTSPTGRKLRKDAGIPRKRVGVVTVCEECGKGIYVYPCQVSKRPRRFCGLACRDKSVLARKHDFIKQLKSCAKCCTWKPFSAFVKTKQSTGLHAYCKECSSKWFHDRRGTPLEKRLPYRPAFTLTIEEKKRRIHERGKQYRKSNLPKVLMWNRLRANRKRAGGSTPHRHEIERLFCDQDGRCPYCSEPLNQYHLDHKLPVSRGGKNGIDNLQLLCRTCNLQKHTCTEEEYLTKTGIVKHIPWQRIWTLHEVERLNGFIATIEAMAH